jgi:branched-chain amino acid transport system permease protein/neutral amino acid transport system permease protein
MYYLQLFINGIVAGFVYALFAVGLTMVYGVFRFINFAHGELIAWGAYWALLFSAPPFNLPVALAILPSVLLTVLMALAQDRWVYAPLRRSDRITLLIASIGASFLLRGALQLFFGSDLKAHPMELKTGMEFGDLFLTHVQLAMVVVDLVFLSGLYLLLSRTLLGKCLRAVSDNLSLAGLMGIPLSRISTAVWTLGGGSHLWGVSFWPWTPIWSP